MQKYKLLVLDIDGTTAASKEQALPSPRVVKAVGEAKEYVHVALATGRPHQYAKPIIDALGLTGLGVFNGGAEIVEMATGEVVSQHLLPVETSRELVKLALPFGVKIYTDEEVNAKGDQYGPSISSPEQVKSETAKLFIDTVPIKSIVPLLSELAAVKGAAAHATSSWSDGDVLDIHVVHEHATKRYGVERLMGMLGHTKEETIAIGDGHNDIPLLEAAGLKIAMGNAPDEVKAIADYVTASLEEDGVAQAIRKFIL